MSSPYGPGNPNDPQQRYPPPHAQHAQPAPYAQHHPGPHEPHQRPAPKPKRKALLLSIVGGGLAVALVAVAGVLLSDKSGDELLPLMPTAADFPQGTKVQAFVDAAGEANADDRVRPLPPEATNPPNCWTHLEVRKNRDDLPDVTRIVTTLDKNDKGQTLAAAQIAKENNNTDAIEQAKAWLAQCQEFDYVYQLKDGQPPVHFKLAPLPGPPAFSDPFFGTKLAELGPQGPLGYRYFFAARVRGLLVLSEGVCDLSTCDEDQDAQLAQQIPIMFSKIVQGLRTMQ